MQARGPQARPTVTQSETGVREPRVNPDVGQAVFRFAESAGPGKSDFQRHIRTQPPEFFLRTSGPFWKSTRRGGLHSQSRRRRRYPALRWPPAGRVKAGRILQRVVHGQERDLRASPHLLFSEGRWDWRGAGTLGVWARTSSRPALPRESRALGYSRGSDGCFWFAVTFDGWLGFGFFMAAVGCGLSKLPSQGSRDIVEELTLKA